MNLRIAMPLLLAVSCSGENEANKFAGVDKTAFDLTTPAPSSWQCNETFTFDGPYALYCGNWCGPTPAECANLGKNWLPTRPCFNEELMTHNVNINLECTPPDHLAWKVTASYAPTPWFTQGAVFIIGNCDGYARLTASYSRYYTCSQPSTPTPTPAPSTTVEPTPTEEPTVEPTPEPTAQPEEDTCLNFSEDSAAVFASSSESQARVAKTKPVLTCKQKVDKKKLCKAGSKDICITVTTEGHDKDLAALWADFEQQRDGALINLNLLSKHFFSKTAKIADRGVIPNFTFLLPVVKPGIPLKVKQAFEQTRKMVDGNFGWDPNAKNDALRTYTEEERNRWESIGKIYAPLAGFVKKMIPGKNVLFYWAEEGSNWFNGLPTLKTINSSKTGWHVEVYVPNWNSISRELERKTAIVHEGAHLALDYWNQDKKEYYCTEAYCEDQKNKDKFERSSYMPASYDSLFGDFMQWRNLQ